MGPEVRFLPSGRRIRVARETPLLDAARSAGLPVASACGGESLCGRCGLEIRSAAAALSAETPEETRAKRRNRVDPALRLACRARVLADLEVTSGYW